MPPKFLEQLKASDWINLGQLATNVVGGLAGGKASARSAEQDWFRQQQDARQAEFNRQLALYNAQLQARSGLGAFYGQTAADRARAAEVALGAMPLGAEQNLAMQMARARGLSGVAETFQPLMPASADIAGLIRPTSNVLSAFTTPDYRASISPEATARSIAERRKAIAGVNPTFQFGSMGDYGLPNLEKEVATYAQGVAADRLSRENQLLNLLTTQMEAANALSQPQSMQGVPPIQSSAAAQPKKTSWWKKVVGTALPIAAAFIPGVGPAASVALQAAAGAAGGALTGGKKGALTGAITGAIGAKTGGLGSAAGQRAATESAKEFTKRAILQPSTLTSTAGKLIGGQTGTVLQAAAPFLGSIKPYDPNAAYTRALPVQAQISKPADFTADILRQAGVSPTAAAPTLGTTFTPSQPYRGAVRPPTFGGPGAVPQGPAVTPRPVPTESTPQLAPELRQMLEQVGRRRSQPNVMYGAAPTVPLPTVNFTTPAAPLTPEQQGISAQLDAARLLQQRLGVNRQSATPVPPAPRPAPAPSPFAAFDRGYANMVASPNASLLDQMPAALTPSQQNYLRGAQTVVNAAPFATAAAIGAPYAAPFMAELWFGPSGMATPQLSTVISSAAQGNAQAAQTLSNIAARMPQQTAEILSKMPPSLRAQLLKSGVKF